jgi:hypothetical protein
MCHSTILKSAKEGQTYQLYKPLEKTKCVHKKELDKMHKRGKKDQKLEWASKMFILIFSGMRCFYIARTKLLTFNYDLQFVRTRT